MLLTNIRKVKYYLDILCNAGSTRTIIIGNPEGYGDVWFYSDEIANIISLHQVDELFHITCDSCEGNWFTVWKKYGSLRRFNPGPRELYFYNLQDVDGTILTTIYADKTAFRSVPDTMMNKAANVVLSTIDTIKGKKFPTLNEKLSIQKIIERYRAWSG